MSDFIHQNKIFIRFFFVLVVDSNEQYAFPIIKKKKKNFLK